MNNKRKYLPTHMRARMAGHPYASCDSCKIANVPTKPNHWCAKRKPPPNSPHPERQLCRGYVPDEP